MTVDDNLRNNYVQRRHLWRYITCSLKINKFAKQTTAFKEPRATVLTRHFSLLLNLWHDAVDTVNVSFQNREYVYSMWQCLLEYKSYVIALGNVVRWKRNEIRKNWWLVHVHETTSQNLTKLRHYLSSPSFRRRCSGRPSFYRVRSAIYWIISRPTSRRLSPIHTDGTKWDTTSLVVERPLPDSTTIRDNTEQPR